MPETLDSFTLNMAQRRPQKVGDKTDKWKKQTESLTWTHSLPHSGNPSTSWSGHLVQSSSARNQPGFWMNTSCYGCGQPGHFSSEISKSLRYIPPPGPCSICEVGPSVSKNVSLYFMKKGQLVQTQIKPENEHLPQLFSWTVAAFHLNFDK